MNEISNEQLYTQEEGFQFNFKLENFEGPLHLLLALVKAAKVDIEEIFVSDITSQYLALMQQDMSNIDMDRATEFIQMAATLLEIKSKALLPTFDEGEDEDEESDEDRIKRQLRELELFKEASSKLKSLETLHRFYRDPEYTEDDTRTVIKDFSFDKLLDAFAMLLHKVDQKPKDPEPKQIVRDRFSVAEKLYSISVAIREKKTMNFSDLFEDDYTKSEIINTFLALLELLKKQVVSAKQEESFGDIILTLKDTEGEITDGETDADY